MYFFFSILGIVVLLSLFSSEDSLSHASQSVTETHGTCRRQPGSLGVSMALYGGITSKGREVKGGGGRAEGMKTRCKMRMKWKFKVTRSRRGGEKTWSSRERSEREKGVWEGKKRDSRDLSFFELCIPDISQTYSAI